MGSVVVDAGRMVRRYDRRLDNEEGSQIGAPCHVLAAGRRLDPHGHRTLRRVGLRHQLHRWTVLLRDHYGGPGIIPQGNCRSPILTKFAVKILFFFFFFYQQSPMSKAWKLPSMYWGISCQIFRKLAFV